MEKEELLCTISGNVNWCGHYGKQYEGFLTKLKIEPPRDPAIPLWGIGPKEMKSPAQRDIYRPMFILALFRIAKVNKQPKRPWMNVQRRAVCTHTHLLCNTSEFTTSHHQTPTSLAQMMAAPLY